MSVLPIATEYPQAPALRDGAMSPEAVARQLYSMTALRARRRSGGTAASVLALRRAYVAGATAYGDAAAKAFWNVAERLAMVVPPTASSYDDRQRKAYDWGWDDAESGRFGELRSSERPRVVYRG